MIISKTPFRISFAGGGTDLPAFYKQEYGAVVNTTIDKYVYIALHDFFGKKIQLKYSKTELVDNPKQIEHPLIREAMLLTNHEGAIEITSFADIPSKGSGLGSSSSFSVGLVNALRAHQGAHTTKEYCAEAACKIEIDRLGEPIGKQDQYAAAYGGFNYMRFNPDGTVQIEPILLSREQKQIIKDNLCMFYTGITRNAGNILAEQSENTSDIQKFKMLRQMRDLADELHERLSKGDIKCVGEILHKNWELKRQLAGGITNEQIDGWYAKGLAAGATGGKLLGAGGGGFLLFWCPKNKQEALKEALNDLEPFDFNFEHQGTQIIHYDN